MKRERSKSAWLGGLTAAPTTGLGKQLATSATEELAWMPNSSRWRPESAIQPASSVLPQRAAMWVVTSELERARQTSRLRQTFRESCHQAGIAAPPMHVIERWLFSCKWHETRSRSKDAGVGGTDPLLPIGGAASLPT